MAEYPDSDEVAYERIINEVGLLSLYVLNYSILCGIYGLDWLWYPQGHLMVFGNN